MKKVCSIALTVLFFMPFLLSFSSFRSSAYTSSSDLYENTTNPNTVYTAYSDGLYLFHQFFKSIYSPDDVSSSDSLSNIRFLSGTWQGTAISELDSTYFYNQTVNGISQTMSYTDEGDYFLYSIIWAVPVVAGDSFTVRYSGTDSSTSFSAGQSAYLHYSFLPGATGFRIVDNLSGVTAPQNPFTFSTNSDNQYIIVAVNPDAFFTATTNDGKKRSRLNRSIDSLVCSDSENLLYVGTTSWFSVYTTPYLLSRDSQTSLTLKDTVDNYSYTVYEVFTDGTSFPGFADSPDDYGDSGDSGDSGNGGSGQTIVVNMAEVVQKLNEVIQAIESKEFTVGVSDEVNNKLDTIIDLITAFVGDSSEFPQLDFSTTTTSAASVPAVPTTSVDSGVQGDGGHHRYEPSLELDDDSVGSVIDSVDDIEIDGGVIACFAFFWNFFDKAVESLHFQTYIIFSLAFAFVIWLLHKVV